MRAKFHLTFPERLINEPVIHGVGKDFDLVTNIPGPTSRRVTPG